MLKRFKSLLFRAQIVFDGSLEEIEEFGVLSDVLLPLRSFVGFAQTDEVCEEVLGKVFCEVLHHKPRKKVDSHIGVDGHYEQSLPFADRMILHNEVFVFELHEFGINLRFVVQM